jgi:hypothetical protein
VDLDCICRNLATIVSHSTALEELVIAGWYESDGLAEHSLPLLSLRVYDGPCQFFNWFSTGKELRTLTLRGDPRALLPRLGHQSPLIQRMELYTNHMSSIFLENISSARIQVKHLRIRADFLDEGAVGLISISF